MDFMRKLDGLAALAARRESPRPLDPSGVMARIRGLSIEDEGILTLPLSFFAGGAAAAAAAAVVVTALAATAWTDISSPLAAVDSLIDVMEML